MRSELLFRFGAAMIWSLALGWIVFSRNDTEIGSESNPDDSQRYFPYIHGSILPFYVSFLVFVLLVVYGTKKAAEMTLSECFGIFLHISLYYAILIPLLPFFRKHISARACAMLWTIPNYLYITRQSYMELPKPSFVIHAPETLVWGIFFIWLGGFTVVLGWNIISHLIVRHRILYNSAVITDPAVLKIWNNEINFANIKKPKFRLVTSPEVTTPLSIGLFSRAVRVVLPERPYTSEELELIFRHEIVHIGREDAWSKFFLVFCTAMCWFNPLMWIAKSKCSEDLELSCDETVLLDSDETVRRKYATLILNTAGEEHGFTTCLSAAASSMRYRLHNIMRPKKRHSGAVIVGLVFFLLCISCGYVGLAYGNKTGFEVIYQSRDTDLYTLRHIDLSGTDYNLIYECKDIDAFHEYMSGLKLGTITGNYSFDSEKQYTFLYDTPEGTLGVSLSDSLIKLTPFYGEDIKSATYYLLEPIDWEYLDTIIIIYPALNLHVRTPDNYYPKEVSASWWGLTKLENGNRTVIYEREESDATPSGMFGYNTAGATATLDFSHSPTADFTVRVETWDFESSYTISQSADDESFTIPLAPYSAHYTVFATFLDDDGTAYEAEFRYDFGDVGD